MTFTLNSAKPSVLTPEMGLQEAVLVLSHLVSDFDFLRSHVLPLLEGTGTAEDWYVGYRHDDPEHSYSLQVFVWPPGSATRVHDHCSWGAFCCVAGSVLEERYERVDDGSLPDYARLKRLWRLEWSRGDGISTVMPYGGGIHRVSNQTEEPAISVHLYGPRLGEIDGRDYDPSQNYVCDRAETPDNQEETAMSKQREVEQRGWPFAAGSERFETVIIGGGQAGLSVGYHLKKQGRPFVILDANERIGDSWRKRWDSLKLFTPARYDGLPGLPFPAPAWSFPTKDEVAGYLETYAARFDLPVLSGVRVDGLSKEADRYVVTAGDRRFEADHVVVASGAYQSPRIPAFAPELDPSIVQLHSSEYRHPSQLQEGGVLVVGAANSGAEIALEVSRNHLTWLSGRHPGQEPSRPGSRWDRLFTPAIWFMLSHVLTVKTPIGRMARQRLHSRGLPLARVRPKDLSAAGIERVPRTTGARDGLPVLDDGRDLEVENVIWCTGFVPDFAWIDLPVFAGDGGPVHERGIVRSEAGLYFVGLFFLFAASSSLVGGVGRDAEHIAKHIASRDPNGLLTAYAPAGARRPEALDRARI